MKSSSNLSGLPTVSIAEGFRRTVGRIGTVLALKLTRGGKLGVREGRAARENKFRDRKRATKEPIQTGVQSQRQL